MSSPVMRYFFMGRGAGAARRGPSSLFRRRYELCAGRTGVAAGAASDFVSVLPSDLPAGAASLLLLSVFASPLASVFVSLLPSLVAAGFAVDLEFLKSVAYQP